MRPGGVLDEALEGRCQRARDCRRSPRARASDQALAPLAGKTMAPLAESGRGTGEGGRDGVQTLSFHDVAPGLGTAADAGCFGLLSVWRLPLVWGPIASNDFLSVRAPPPVTCFSLRLLTSVGSPVGDRPISPTAFLPSPAGYRAASTSPKAAVCLSTAKLLRLLCGRLPQGRPRSRGSATGPGGTGAPPRPFPCASRAFLRHQRAPATRHSGPSQGETGPTSRPTPWSSRAQAGCPPWRSLVPAPARHWAPAAALRLPSRLPRDASATRARPNMP